MDGDPSALGEDLAFRMADFPWTYARAVDHPYAERSHLVRFDTVKNGQPFNITLRPDPTIPAEKVDQIGEEIIFLLNSLNIVTE